MISITRRTFGAVAAGGALFASDIASPAIAAGPAKIVIIGGGAGGATAAARLKSADPKLDVTIIEPKTQYTTCFYSNLYLGGFRSFQSITHTYDGVKKRGVTVVTDTASAVDTTAKTVTLASGGSTLSYDKLIMAPGIDFKFDAIEGYSEQAAEIMPHAWQGGPQTWSLKEKLLALPDGGLVVMTVPANPYRCPPGPYERACMIGHFLKARKPRSKLILLDAKRMYSKQAAFEEAFAEYYAGVVEIALTNEIDDFAVQRVDPATGLIVTKTGRKETAALANIIPPQRAGAIAQRAGLTDGDWCPVKPGFFSSTLAKDVYVIGDAAVAAEMPKSAFAAASHAGVAVSDIIADLAGKPHEAGQPRNTCWSMVAPQNSIKIGADYKPGVKDGKPILTPIEPFVSKPGESVEMRLQQFQESSDWYRSATAEMFGTDPAQSEAP